MNIHQYETDSFIQADLDKLGINNYLIRTTNIHEIKGIIKDCRNEKKPQERAA